jgi:hypothetical protein
MKIMASPDNVRKILQPLVGQPIWSIRRSHGSYFTADFGAVRHILPLPTRQFANGRVVPERQIQRGTWSLMVELCRWRIEVGGNATSDLDDDHTHMQTVMSALDGAIIDSIELNAETLAFRFSNDGRMSLGPAEYFAPGDTMSQWVIFLPDGTNLSRDTDGRLSHEQNMEQIGQ